MLVAIASPGRKVSLRTKLTWHMWGRRRSEKHYWSASGVPRNTALPRVVLSSVVKNISFNVSTSLGGKFCAWQVKTANTRTRIEETHLLTDVAECTSGSLAELQSGSPRCWCLRWEHESQGLSIRARGHLRIVHMLRSPVSMSWTPNECTIFLNLRPVLEKIRCQRDCSSSF